MPGLRPAGAVSEAERAPAGAERADLAAARQRPPGVEQVGGVRARDHAEVDDAGVGRVQRGEATRVRLDALELGALEPAQSRHAVGAPGARQLAQARQLGGARRDDQLAAALVRDRIPFAVLVEGTRPAVHSRAFSEPGR